MIEDTNRATSRTTERFMRIRLGTLVIAVLCVGCTPARHSPSTDGGTGPQEEVSDVVHEEEEEIVVYARYVPLREMVSYEPKREFERVTDSFQVEKVVHGDFPKFVEIRVNRQGVVGPDYPQHLEFGKKYFLQIKATERIKKDLVRYQDDTIDWLSMAPDEISVGVGE
jgi:hypothetical protein